MEKALVLLRWHREKTLNSLVDKLIENKNEPLEAHFLDSFFDLK